MPKTVDIIAGEIMSEMERLLLERIYTAIIKAGQVLYASTALDKHIELLKLFAITEFKQLPIFGHAFPLPGTNLAIFKLTDDILVGLYSKKGYQGQLLSFKTKMNQYLEDLKQASEGPVEEYMDSEERGQVLPKLIQTVSLTLGLSEDESAVLKLCDGNHSVNEIIVKTRVPRKVVVDILRRYEEKEWLKLDYKGEVDIIPISIKKFPETAVRLGMISKKSYDINELCNGSNTIQDIARKLIISERELKKILEKMEKNKIIKMSVKLPEQDGEVFPTSMEGMRGGEIESISNPELYIKPILTTSVSFTMGFDQEEKQILELLNGEHTIVDIFTVTQIPVIDIFKAIFKYEDKGWIRIPIDDFMKIVAVKEKLKSEFDSAVLAAQYNKYMEQQGYTAYIQMQTPEPVIQETSLVIEDEQQVRDTLLYRIEQELPLMPIDARNKLVDKLTKLSAHSRDAMLDKLLTSESSMKFRRIEREVGVTPVQPTETLQIPTTVPPIEQAPIPPPMSPPMPPRYPSDQMELPKPTQTTPIVPVIDETPLIQPSKLLNTTVETDPLVTPLPDDLLSPRIPTPPSVIEEPTPSPQVDAKPPSHLLSETIPAQEERINEVLNFIDSLLGIPEILYIALIDYGGAIFYQTTKETNLWDISNNTTKLVQNWSAQAPSVFLGDNIKYAVIKTEPEMLIATNVKGFGHIVAIPINEKLFILTKVSKEGDALLIADDVSIVAKQINQMFQGH
ncbi:MAG: hypothetical protein EU536_00595 [Promethearchaeota archaeon]|nr:MAG: hypothetical protein EU536_00595 [Candidatus Lokiarchaeota archaeon]